MSMSVSGEFTFQETDTYCKEVNQFEVGDMVRRVGDSSKMGGVAEALGMIGTIHHFIPSREWPPESGLIVPGKYFVYFPELFKGTLYEGVLIAVAPEDLVLQRKAS